jgi:hypothetical protein
MLQDAAGVHGDFGFSILDFGFGWDFDSGLRRHCYRSVRIKIQNRKSKILHDGASA